jgi:hypothetical protein
VVVSVYRPPDASEDFFTSFGNLLQTINDENKEILNCDLLKPNPNHPTNKLRSLFEIYQLTQLIDEATRITETSSTLIDHFVTNEPEKFSKCGVIYSGISDHSLIYAIRKININHKFKENIIEIRNTKNINENKLDLKIQSWENVYFFADNSSSMWQIWKELFLQVLDKHAPLQSKKIKSKIQPWITNHIKQMIITRDKLKRRAIVTQLESDWENYKRARNETNTQLRLAKKEYYTNKIYFESQNPKAAWKTINSL